MLPEIFVLSLAVFMAFLFHWGFRNLPAEKWQIMGCLPSQKDGEGTWQGINVTYYGFFNATAYLLAVVLCLILMGSMSIPLAGTIAFVTIILGICMPASRIIAHAVEGKPHTFTVGGASFTGLLIAPWTVLLVNMTAGKWMGFEVPVVSMLAALSIAYAVGEGTGRLACISFGCCYGKPLSLCHPLIRGIFARRNFVFFGETKKIAYAHHFDGQEVVPIQGLTAVLYTGSGLLGFYLFLKGYPGAALIGTIMGTQGWRVFSENFRADYRGNNKITAYQMMAICSVVYTSFLFFFLPVPQGKSPDLIRGLQALWHPGIILFLQVLWVLVFMYTGRSRVTGAAIRLHVIKENT